MPLIEISFTGRGRCPKDLEIEGDALGIVDMRQSAHRLERSRFKRSVGRSGRHMTGVALQGRPAALPAIDVLEPVTVPLEKVNEFDTGGLAT
jgi:hypothetical protein